METITPPFKTNILIQPLIDIHTRLTFTDLDLTETQNAFDQGKHAFAANDYEKAIQSYSMALNHLHYDIEAAILLYRAAAHEEISS